MSCDQLRLDLAALRDLVETNIPVLAEQRRIREARAREERLQAIGTLPADALIAALDAMPERERSRFRWTTALSMRVVHELRGAARAHAIELMPIDTAVEVSFALTPKVLDLVAVEFGHAGATPYELVTNATPLSDEDAARAVAAGLRVVRSSVTREPMLAGFDYLGCGGERYLIERRAWSLRVELCESTRMYLRKGIFVVSDVAEDEARGEMLRRWRATSHREALPPLPKAVQR